MRVIVGSRQSGKTAKLIRLSAEHGSYIVCPTRRDVARIAARAKDMNLRISLPITFEEFLGHRYYARGVRGFLIDNADQLLAYLSDVPIHAITINVEEEDVNNNETNVPLV